MEDQPDGGPQRAEKQASTLSRVHRRLLALFNPEAGTVVMWLADEADGEARGSYVGKTRAPRWLWHARDHRSGHGLGYVLGRRRAEGCLRLKALVAPWGITRYSTDSWGAYTGHLGAAELQPGQRNTQQLERQPRT
jgi:IS1 family transposase